MKNPNFNYTDLKKRSERYGTITIIGRKSQFKGNSVNVYTAEQDEIIIGNSYYTSHVRQNYSIKNNTTIIDYHIDGGFNVKWLDKKFNKTASDLQISPQGLNLEVRMTKNMKCVFNSYQYSLHHETVKKGLMFQGNIDNINNLKEFRHILSGVRKIIKKVDLAELIRHQIDYSTGQIVSIAKLDTNSDHGDRIIINYNELFKFNKLQKNE